MFGQLTALVYLLEREVMMCSMGMKMQLVSGQVSVLLQFLEKEDIMELTASRTGINCGAVKAFAKESLNSLLFWRDCCLLLSMGPLKATRDSATASACTTDYLVMLLGLLAFSLHLLGVLASKH